MRTHGLWLLGVIACRPPTPLPAQVRPGIEVLLSDSSRLIAGKRLALLTNQTGRDRDGRRDVDLLLAAVPHSIVALYGPEHGARGTEDRPGLPDDVDSATGLPIYSLYTSGPNYTPLDSVDAVLIDLQDVGARYYTYPASAVLLMREAARRGKPVIVLDRPDPIGGDQLQGNMRPAPVPLDSGGLDFLPLPMRHGMTLGELLRFANAVYGLNARLTVVPAAGWRRDMVFDATGLPWIKPSPNMPSLESAWHYPGICLFEATNLSVGRGTPYAFQEIGAPWLNADAVLRQLRQARDGSGAALQGVEVTPTSFTPHGPTDGKYDAKALRGLRFRVTDRRQYDPTHLAVALLSAIRAVHPDSLHLRDVRFDQLAGGPALRYAVLSGVAASTIWRSWDEGLDRFRETRVKYLLY